MPDIAHNQIHLWLVEDQQIHDQDLLESYRALLNAEEEKRLERLIFPKHRHQFLLSRALVRTVLGEYLEQAPESLVFARNAYGKPRIASFEKTTPLNFNLTHTNGLSVLAVNLEDEVGVDAEYLTRKVDILSLARRYFSTHETEALQALEVHRFNERFFDLWTLKEAYIKACGMGLAIPLKDFTFHFATSGITISFDAEREDHPDHWRFWQFVFKQNFQIALALKNTAGRLDKKIEIREGIPLKGFRLSDLVAKNSSLQSLSG